MKKSDKNKHKNLSSLKQSSIPEHAEGSFMKTNRWSIIIITVIVIVILVCAYFLWPKVTITPGKIINPREPFNTSFIIQNHSHYSIYSIKSECLFLNIEDDNHHIFNRLTANIDTGYIEKLSQSEAKLIIFKLNITTKELERSVLKANIKFLLSYKVPFIGLQLSKSFPLTVQKTSVNTYKWFATN